MAEKAALDPRFQFFHELPEDSYEAFLSVPLMCRGRVVGVINLQHREPHVYRRREIRLISTVGFLVGAEIEMARLEDANLNLSEQLQTRKIVERAKGILQRDLGLSEEQAYLALQRQSRQKRKAMKEIAEAIVLSEEVKGNSRRPVRRKPLPTAENSANVGRAKENLKTESRSLADLLPDAEQLSGGARRKRCASQPLPSLSLQAARSAA